MSNVQPYSISRVLNAPRALVFQASTDVGHLSKWLSPGGFKNIHANGEIKVGGIYHYGIQGPDGSQMWGKQRYLEIVPHEKIVLIQSFSDKDGGLTRHPFAPAWPLEMLATTTFEDAGPGKTKMTVTWAPHDSDEAGDAAFDGARSGMDQGFAGSFANLEAHLAATETQLSNSRVVDAPRELVWKAFTETEHVNAWWGPSGFKNVEVEQDIRVGGVWKFKMVAPDGKVYLNKSTYIEIKAPERLVYDLGDWDTVHFRASVTLAPIGKKTLVTLSVECPTRGARDGLLGYAIDGGKQTLAKLDEYLKTMK